MLLSSDFTNTNTSAQRRNWIKVFPLLHNFLTSSESYKCEILKTGIHLVFNRDLVPSLDKQALSYAVLTSLQKAPGSKFRGQRLLMLWGFRCAPVFGAPYHKSPASTPWAKDLTLTCPISRCIRVLLTPSDFNTVLITWVLCETSSNSPDPLNESIGFTLYSAQELIFCVKQRHSYRALCQIRLQAHPLICCDGACPTQLMPLSWAPVPVSSKMPISQPSAVKHDTCNFICIFL